MRVHDTSQRGQLYLSILRLLLIGIVLALGVLVLTLFAHAATGSDILLRPAEALAAALGLLAASSFVLGIAYVWSAYPKHHRPVLFIVILTVGTLLAHVYIMGAPPAATPGTLVGAVGVELSDGQINIQSTLHNQNLSVIARSIGGSAIGDLQLSAPGATLVGTGFAPQPTFSSPLGSGSATRGTWQVVSGNATELVVSYQRLSCYDVGSGHYGCIMDESFYVPESMGVLAGQPCSDSYVDGFHCHMEHPYLAPALVAAGMAVFGEFSSASWRAFPALLGTFSIPLVFGICWKLANDKRIAYLASLFLALDVMFFSQSSAALLDIPETFFGIAAMFAYVWGIRIWKLDRYVIAGVLLGLAGLAKETAVFFALGLLTYILFFEQGTLRKRIFQVVKVALVLGLVFIVGLQAYDSTMVSSNGLAPGIANSCPGQKAYSSTPNFIDHIRYMLCYGSSLIAHTIVCQGAPTGASGYWCKFPNSHDYSAILPTDWLLYYTPVAYYSTSVSVCPNSVNGVCVSGQYTYVQLAYYGVTNLVVTWTVFAWVPLMAFALYKGYRKPKQSLEAFGFGQEGERAPLESDVKFAGFTLSWFGWNYVPYLFLLLGGRVTYPFYIVPAIPALAMGAAYFATRKWFPRWLIYIYVAAVLVFFFVFFPDKAFLPDWLRVIIGH